jgi:hypothetical protein
MSIENFNLPFIVDKSISQIKSHVFEKISIKSIISPE